jgi:hypothetical protein
MDLVVCRAVARDAKSFHSCALNLSTCPPYPQRHFVLVTTPRTVLSAIPRDRLRHNRRSKPCRYSCRVSAAFFAPSQKLVSGHRPRPNATRPPADSVHVIDCNKSQLPRPYDSGRVGIGHGVHITESFGIVIGRHDDVVQMRSALQQSVSNEACKAGSVDNPQETG